MMELGVCDNRLCLCRRIHAAGATRRSAGGAITGPAMIDPDSVPVMAAPAETWLTAPAYRASSSMIKSGTIVHIIDANGTEGEVFEQ